MDSNDLKSETNESCNDSDDSRKDSSSRVVPAYLSAVLRRQYLQEMVKSFPANIRNRITVLKNIQLEHLQLEAEFFEEVYKLEKLYQQKYQPLFDKRAAILTGKVDPPLEKPKWSEEPIPELDVKHDELSKIIKDLKKLPEDTKGIPNFWLTVFKNTEILSEMVQDHDEAALRKLTDIKISYDNEHSYTLEFHFDKNEYFSNAVLTKQYFLKSKIDETYPFSFEGPEIYMCKGCNINWEKKMNLTVKTIRKKQKHKERGAVRTIVRQVPNDSFFNFFNPPEMSGDKNEIDEDSQSILATDFEIGHFLRARIIPKAILYYTGDIIDDEDDEDDDEYDGEEEEDDDESDNEAVESNEVSGKKKQNPNDCPNQ